MEQQAVAIIEKRVNDVVARANAIVVDSSEKYEAINQFINTIKTARKEVHDTFDPIVDAANQTHKKAVAQRNNFLTPLTIAETISKTKSTDWWLEQERIRKETERKRQEEADREAEKERAKLEKKAEKEETKGNEEKAEELREQADEVETTIDLSPPPAVKPSGISYTKRWHAEVVSKKLLLKAILDGLVSPDCVNPNMSALNKLASINKNIIKTPGIVFRCTTSQSNRI